MGFFNPFTTAKRLRKIGLMGIGVHSLVRWYVSLSASSRNIHWMSKWCSTSSSANNWSNSGCDGGLLR